MEGKALYVEGMISKKGDPFNANIQFNADKRYVEFLFNIGKLQNQSSNQEHQPTIETFKIFRGKELSNEQFDKFKDGQTVYVDNLIDKMVNLIRVTLLTTRKQIVQIFHLRIQQKFKNNLNQLRIIKRRLLLTLMVKPTMPPIRFMSLYNPNNKAQKMKTTEIAGRGRNTGKIT